MMTDHHIAQLMNMHSLQDGNNDSPWWLTFARAVEARAGADARHALEDECKRTDSLLTILGLEAERCRSEGGALVPQRVLALLADAKDGTAPNSAKPLHTCANAFTGSPGKCGTWCGDERICPRVEKAASSGVFEA